jgi:hypothetical protein
MKDYTAYPRILAALVSNGFNTWEAATIVSEAAQGNKMALVRIFLWCVPRAPITLKGKPS